jgi:excisionase family DNA binding protein
VSKDKTEAPAASDKAGQVDRQVYSITEAATMLGIGRSMAYQLAKGQELPGVRLVGHRYVVLKSVLDAWLAGAEVAA